MKKYIFIGIIFPTILFGQTPKLTKTTQQEFEVSRSKEVVFFVNDKIVKSGKTLSIKPKKGKTVKFEDDLSDEGYQTHEYVGDLLREKIALVKTQDYNTDRYVAVDLSTGETKTLIGFPHVYGDNVICLQGAETDVTPQIELWKIREGKLTSIKTFTLGEGIYPSDIAWINENEVVIIDSTAEYWKMRVDGK